MSSKLFGRPRSEVIKHPGAFSKAAADAGMTTHEFQTMIMNHPGRFSPRRRKQAALARTFEKMRSKKR
jgi:hypothetical protein